MGVWTVGTFGHDQALDWLSDLLDEQDVYFIHNTLEIIGDYSPTESPDPWDCNCALAAAEIVAASLGNPDQDLPKEANVWLSKFPVTADAELMSYCRKAIERIESSSELKDVWEKLPQKDQWYQYLGDLKRRLRLV